MTEKIIIHLLSGLKNSLGVYRGKGGQQGAVKYSIQSFKWKPTTCAKTHKLRNSKKHFKQSPIGCKRLMRLRSAANNQATRRNEQIKSYLQLGSSSNRYAPRLPQQETKSSTKQLAPTDPILGPENLLKTGFAQKGLPSTLSCLEAIPMDLCDICSLMRKAATLATPECLLFFLPEPVAFRRVYGLEAYSRMATPECLLYESYWFRPILSELIGAATETATINRNRAPSGPVKVSVPTQPQERPQGGVSLTSGVAALLAWFPASWASKVAPCLLSKEVHHRTHKRWQYPASRERPLGCNELNETESFKQSGSLIRKPQALTLVSTKTTKLLAASRKYVIIPSQGGITPEQWKQTATLCPLDWPTNYSLLRLWHLPMSLHQFANLLYKQLDHRHMFTQWSLDLKELAERAVFHQPATYFTDAALQEHWRDLDFPSRKLRQRPPAADLAAFRAKRDDLRQHAVTQEQRNPVSFSLENSWTDTVQDDKNFYQNNTMLRMA